MCETQEVRANFASLCAGSWSGASFSTCFPMVIVPSVSISLCVSLRGIFPLTLDCVLLMISHGSRPSGSYFMVFSGASYMLIACAPVWWILIRKRLAIRYPVASSPDNCQQIVLWSFCGEHEGLLRLGWSSLQWYLLKEALSRLHVSVLCWDPLRFVWSEPQRHLSRQAWSRL